MYFQGLIRKGLLLFPFLSLLFKQFMLSKNKIFYLLSLVKNMPFYHRVNYHLMKILLDFYLVTSNLFDNFNCYVYNIKMRFCQGFFYFHTPYIFWPQNGHLPSVTLFFTTPKPSRLIRSFLHFGQYVFSPSFPGGTLPT